MQSLPSSFFAQVQNKLHWAVTGHTAAGLIHERVDVGKPNMGLSSWKQAPSGKILKSDVTVVKNYLSEDELKELNRIVSMYLDFAEGRALRKRLMNMQDWVSKLDSFLAFNEYELLNDAGKVTSSIAKALAETEFEKFRVIQDEEYISDFDRLVTTMKDVEKE